MTEEVKEEKKLEKKPEKPKSVWSDEEKKLISNYGCQLLAEDATKEQVDAKSWPTDAVVVTYKSKDKLHQDLCRGPRVNIFDLYFDKFGKGALQSIDFGSGTVNPTQWGYKAPEKKRRRKG